MIQSMKYALTLLILLSASSAYGSRRLPTNQVHYSTDKNYLLKVFSSRAAKPGNCRAELYSVTNAQEKLIWSRYLINDYAPEKIAVANTGFVITVGDWRGTGNGPEIALYGKYYGRLVKTLTPQSLGIAEFKKPTNMFGGKYSHVLVFFDPTQNVAYIKFHWGDLVGVYLPTGAVATKNMSFTTISGKRIPYPEYGKMRLKQLVLELVNRNNWTDELTGALYAGQLKFPEAKTRLRELLSNDSWYKSMKTKFYPTRKAAKEALEAMGETVEGVVVEEKVD